MTLEGEAVVRDDHGPSPRPSAATPSATDSRGSTPRGWSSRSPSTASSATPDAVTLPPRRRPDRRRPDHRSHAHRAARASPARQDDIDDVCRACQDPESQRWLTIPVPYTPGGRASSTWPAARPAPRRRGLLAVIEADGRFVGSAGLHFPASLLGPGVGYWLAPWGAAADTPPRPPPPWPSGRSRTAPTACTCSPTSPTRPRRTWPGRAGFVEEGRDARLPPLPGPPARRRPCLVSRDDRSAQRPLPAITARGGGPPPAPWGMALDLTGVDLTTEVVRTERLLLRPMRRGRRRRDRPRLRGRGEPAVADRAAVPVHPRGRRRVRHRGRPAAAGPPAPTWCCAVEAGGEFVGVLGLHSLAGGRLGPEIGYWIASWARRSGLRGRGGAGAGRLGAGARSAARAPVHRRRQRGRRRRWRGGPVSRRRASCAAAWSTATGGGADAVLFGRAGSGRPVTGIVTGRLRRVRR